MIINHSYNPSPQWAWKFKELLHQELKKLPDDFTLSFSAGIDSSMILYSLMEIGKPPKQLLTFQIEDWETDDLIYAKKISKELGIPLTISKVPRPRIQELNNIVYDIKKRTGDFNKIQMQVNHLFWYMLKEIQTPNLVLGMYEDVIYETNASLQINYRKVLRGEYSKSQFDKDYSYWKTNCYNNINKSGNTHNHYYIDKFIQSYGVTTHFPLKTESIWKLFQSVDYPTTHLYPYKDGYTIKKKWFVTHLLWKDQFDRFGNGKNNSNMHVKKKGNDINQLHCEVYNCKPSQLVGKYNKINNYVRDNWFN